MKVFQDTGELIKYLQEQGVSHQIDSEFQAEVFCRQRPELNLFYQNPEYLVRGAPKFVLNLATETKVAEFTAHKFVKGKKLTFTKRVKFKTSIPFQNEYLTAFEGVAWRALWELIGADWYQKNSGYSSFFCKFLK